MDYFFEILFFSVIIAGVIFLIVRGFRNIYNLVTGRKDSCC